MLHYSLIGYKNHNYLQCSQRSDGYFVDHPAPSQQFTVSVCVSIKLLEIPKGKVKSGDKKLLTDKSIVNSLPQSS